MKRVLIFSLTYHPFIGGAEIAVKEITDRCERGAYAFEMITLRADANLPRQEQVGNVLVHRVGFAVRGARVSDRTMPLAVRLSKMLFPFLALARAMRLHRQRHFDIAWAMMANHAGFAALFFTWMYPHVPLFLELQDGRPFAEIKQRRSAMRILWPLYKRIYLSAAVIKCISYFLAEQMRLISYGGRVEVIPNGVDFARFSAPVPEEKLAALREKFGKRVGDVFLFTASRLVLSRGVEDAIGALAHLPQQVKFLIAGEGEDREKLEHIASGLRVHERVIFAGQVSHLQLPAYLQMSDIFVRPSIIEGFGNSFVEAMAAGVPVIGTPVGGIPDFLKDGETGLFCQVRDPQSIAGSVERYVADPALKARIIEKARALAADKYDWDLIAHEMRTNIFAAL